MIPKMPTPAGRWSRAMLPWLLCVPALLAGNPPARAEPDGHRVEIEAPGVIHGVQIRDVDGDGAQDVLLLEGRRVLVFAGREQGLPAAKPRWSVSLPADVTFLDVLPPAQKRPAFVVLGRAGTRRVAMEDGAVSNLKCAEGALSWVEIEQANFAGLVRAGGVLGPTPRGVRWCGIDGRTASLELPQRREVAPPGQYLEERTIVTEAMPQVWAGARPSNGAPPLLWALTEDALVAADEGGPRHRHDVSFLPQEGVRRLVDLTGDGVPDVTHERGSNRERTFAFFRTPAPEAGAEARLTPPAAVLRLSGYCLPPDFVDLDGDGRLDFVVTAIPIDMRNTVRALGGQVTAGTKAFLNRGGMAGKRLFSPVPDADVISDVSVTIRFSAAGTIDIERSFTILVTGDYDGDGLTDLAIRTAPDELSVRRGVRGGGVWADEVRTVKIPPMGASPSVEGWAADLTGDGKDEIVVVYRRPPGGRDRVWLIQP